MGRELRLELDPEVPLAPMNPLEIELVLVNLVRNAVEAGGGKRGGLDPHPADRVAACASSVGDNGCGMNQEQLAHVFDPFYTTRRQLGGSGLGMSIAYGIVQGHEGRMEVQSQPRHGNNRNHRSAGATSERSDELRVGQEGQEEAYGPNPDCRG